MALEVVTEDLEVGIRAGLGAAQAMVQSILRALLGILLLGLWPLSAAATPIVEFRWSPEIDVVQLGTTEVLVDLLAVQSGGADAAYLTLGFTTLGIVTGVELQAFGPSVSASDSFFGESDGIPTLIASAPSIPGSFGSDADFVVATLRLSIDTKHSRLGFLSLLDLSAIAGSPALAQDGITPVASDLSRISQVRVVPESATGLLLLVGAAGLSIARRIVRKRRG